MSERVSECVCARLTEAARARAPPPGGRRYGGAPVQSPEHFRAGFSDDAFVVFEGEFAPKTPDGGQVRILLAPLPPPPRW